MFGMFYVVFFLVIAMFIFVFVKGISEWVHNNNSPRLSVDAKIVDKRNEMPLLSKRNALWTYICK